MDALEACRIANKVNKNKSESKIEMKEKTTKAIINGIEGSIKQDSEDGDYNTRIYFSSYVGLLDNLTEVKKYFTDLDFNVQIANDSILIEWEN